MGKRSSVPLRTFARRAAAAWEDVRQAENALGELAGERPRREHRKVLEHLGTAREALRKAYCEIVPHGRRTGKVNAEPRIERSEPLARCLLCGGLVWERQRRSHLEVVDCVNVSAFDEKTVEAYFEAVSRDELGDDEDDEDEQRRKDLEAL